MRKGYQIFWGIFIFLVCLLLTNHKTFAATNIHVGDYLEIGKYNNNPLIWEVVDFDKNGDAELLSNSIISFRNFNTSDSNYSNKWENSDLRQWLNSTSSTSTDEMEKGFLHEDNFRNEEKALIKPVSHKVILSKDFAEQKDGGKEPYSLSSYLFPTFYPTVKEYTAYLDSMNSSYDISSLDRNNDGIVDFMVVVGVSKKSVDQSYQNYDSAYYKNILDTIFVPSIKEIKEWLSDRGKEVQGKSANFATNKNVLQYTSPSYWLRTPDGIDPLNVATIESAGDVFLTTADSESVGVRPAMIIKKEYFKINSGDGSENTPYSMKKVAFQLTKTSLTVQQGYGKQVEYTLLDGNTNVKWSSKNTKVATVSQNGVVTGISKGTTEVIAKPAFGEESVCKIIVKAGTTTVKPLKKVLTPKDNHLIYYSGNSYNPLQTLQGGPINLIDQDGNFNIVYESNKKVYISKINNNLEVSHTVAIKKEMNKFGSSVIDPEGNFYILWGQAVKESKTKESLKLVKYSNNGNKLGEVGFNGYSLDVVNPFSIGNVSMIYSNGIVIAHFSRDMFKYSDGLNHEASQAIFVDSKTMQPKEIEPPYTSHSMDQQVIATLDGGYLFVEQGDGFPRGFSLTKIEGNSDFQMLPFQFREGTNWKFGYNNTFAQLGGIAETDEGYVLVGSSEKTLSAKYANSIHNESHNLFIQIIKKDAYKSTKNLTISDFINRGEQRPFKEASIQPKRISAGVGDAGVQWLTNYSKNQDALDPKVMQIEDGNIIIMWRESKTYLKKPEESTIYYMILNKNGDTIRAKTKVSNAMFNDMVVPVYKSGIIYWTNPISKADKNGKLHDYIEEYKVNVK